MSSFGVSPLGEFRRLGSSMSRAEGICIDRNGDTWVSEPNNLVGRIGRAGALECFGSGGVRPNGIAADAVGRLVVADIGAGAIVRLNPLSGHQEVLADEADGRPTRAANYPAIDADGRIWCSNSTLLVEPREALRERPHDGFIFVVDLDGHSRLVADGLQFPNAIAFSKDLEYLYVAETTGFRISRARVHGSVLGPFEPFGPPLPASPDGIAFDELGNLWITLVIETHAIAALDRSGDLHLVVEDRKGEHLRWPTSIAFGGVDSHDLLISSIALDHVLVARTAVAGLPLPGWPPEGPSESQDSTSRPLP